MNPTPARAAAFAVPPEMTAAVDAVHAALAKSKKINEMINQAVADVSRLHGEISSIQRSIASIEVDEALAEEADSKAFRKTIDRQRAELTTKEGDFRRAQLRIPLMEQKAPECDVEIATAGRALQAEYQLWVEGTKAVLAAEVEEAIKPLVDVIEKVRAVGWVNYMSFLDDVLVPDLMTYTQFQPGLLRACDISTNKLKGQRAGAEAQAKVDEIRALIKPVEQALTAVRSHIGFVPFDRTAKPYVIKGWGSAYYDRIGQQTPEAAQRR